MSHRKYERPRHGSLGFMPRKRCTRGQGRPKGFPKDDPQLKPHLTSFMTYKAGMTHVLRDIDRPGSKLNKKECVEAVTVLDAPPMVCVGVHGLIETATGEQTLGVVFADHLGEECRRRLMKNWVRTKKNDFSHYSERVAKHASTMEEMKAKCSSIRAICHTQITKTPLKVRRAHLMGIPINGGSITERVEFVSGLFEQQIPVSSVFGDGQYIDTIAITKGKGTQGVIKRWGVKKLPRKTHRGFRKVACVGAWHPARVQWQVARNGQQGYHHRTEINKRIYRIGAGGDPLNATTPADVTEKSITPMGGFKHYGAVSNDFLMVRGSIQGPRRRVITIRQALFNPCTRKALEEINLKFIDTSSKHGRGRFQTSKEKKGFYGPLKRDRLRAAAVSAA